MVPIVHEPPGRYDVIIKVARDGGQLPDPVTFAVAADQAASRRFASIISVHMADTIINVVTVTAPGRYAALAIARAVVSDALKAPGSLTIQLGSDAPVMERRTGRCLLELAAADLPSRRFSGALSSRERLPGKGSNSPAHSIGAGYRLFSVPLTRITSVPECAASSVGFLWGSGAVSRSCGVLCGARRSP